MTGIAFMERMKFSKKLPLLLSKRGLNQSSLARMIGTDPARVSDWTNEKGRGPTMQQALMIARALDVSLDYLADDEADDPPIDRSQEEKQLIWLAEQIGYELAFKRLALVGENAPLPGTSYGDKLKAEADQRRQARLDKT